MHQKRIPIFQHHSAGETRPWVSTNGRKYAVGDDQKTFLPIAGHLGKKYPAKIRYRECRRLKVANLIKQTGCIFPYYKKRWCIWANYQAMEQDLQNRKHIWDLNIFLDETIFDR
jgi:hypothetical protein